MAVTERMVSDFKEHAVWRQLEKDVVERISVLKEELTLLDPKVQMTELCRHQGRIDGMLFIIGALEDYVMDSRVAALEREQNKKREEEI